MIVPPDLPGADLVRKGIEDAERGERTVEALLVAIGGPRLRRLGVAAPALASSATSFELELYARLARDDERSAHARYNALIRRLVSCERALELEASRAARASGGA